MVCRETHIGSAMTSYVRILEGIEEYQSLSLYHELMREGEGAAIPAPEDREAFITEMAAKVETSSSFTAARKRSLQERLARARSQSVTGDIYYATQRIEQRAHRAKVALDDYYGDTARALGLTVGQVRNRLSASYEESRRERSLVAPTEWVREFTRRPGNANLPMDRHTAYGMWRLDNEVAALHATAPSRPVITRHTRVRGAGISAVGYDPRSQRLEVEMRSRPGQFYAYRNVPADVAQELLTSDHPTRVFNQNVRNRADMAYPDQATADAAGIAAQCASCGQFTGAGHNCPPRGSAEEAAGMAERARIQAQVVAARRAVASGTEEQRIAALTGAGVDPAMARQRIEDENAAAAMSPETTERHRRNQRLAARIYPYRGDSGLFRCTALSTVRNILADEEQALVPVSAHVAFVADQQGNPTPVTPGEVSGRVRFTRSLNGYEVTGLEVNPDVNPEDRLQCTCLDYRQTYDCVHVRQLLSDMTRRINQHDLRVRHSISDAVTAVTAEATAEHDASVAAQQVAIETAPVPEVVYAEDMAAFQADYRAAKAKIAAGENPVPYLTENATGGLGARDGGRAFGLELEFKFPDGMPYNERANALSRIAEDLYAAELTATDYQTYYHAAASGGGYATSHFRGWSFEEDGSVDGEIVSPIMYDEPETWEAIAKVCEIVKRHGGEASAKCGSHVHVSTGDYDHTVGNHNRLLGIFHENEDTIYRLASSPERGEHRAMNGNSYANPNMVPANGYASVGSAASANTGYVAINLEDTRRGGSSDHAEFRVWDGTMEPGVIQAQIKMSLAMTQAAFRDTDYTPGEHLPVGSTRAHNRSQYGTTRRLTGEQWKADTEGFRKFADRLFHRREDKAQLTALFAATKWQQHRSARAARRAA